MVEVELVKPCVDDPDHYTVHGELGVDVDLETLSGRLPEGARCVPDLGVARFELDEKEVTLYDDGGFDSRKVKDEDDALELAKKLLHLIEGKT